MDYRLSSPQMTVRVTVDDDYGRIVAAPAVVRKFVGQTRWTLEDWMSRQGEVTVEILEAER